MLGSSEEKPKSPFLLRLHEIIFESDTREGKLFDVALIWAILLSVVLVLLESVKEIRADYGDILYAGEWFFTILFSIELILRMASVRRPLRYLFSFYGIVDLLATIPTYISLFLPGAQSLLVVRIFRLMRIFRIFKLATYLGEAEVLTNAIRSSRPKITVFLVAVGSTVVTTGAVMYLIEGEQSGFNNIPKGIYWAIVTMTTVGYGDITPQTPLGQFLASCLMIAGYGIIAVPTGIVTTELSYHSRKKISGQSCPACGQQGHDNDAIFCKHCGAKI